MASSAALPDATTPGLSPARPFRSDRGIRNCRIHVDWCHRAVHVPIRSAECDGVTPEQCAAATKRHVLAIGAAFATRPSTQQRARDLGLSAWSFYIAGRGGALGSDTRADT